MSALQPLKVAKDVPNKIALSIECIKQIFRAALTNAKNIGAIVRLFLHTTRAKIGANY